MEVGDLGEVGQVAGGVWGLSANPHYVALVPVHPNENQRLSGLTGVEGWVGLGLEEVGGWNWWAEKERGLWIRGIIFKSAFMQTTNKHTCNLQVDALCRLFARCRKVPMWRRLLSCS